MQEKRDHVPKDKSLVSFDTTLTVFEILSFPHVLLFRGLSGSGAGNSRSMAFHEDLNS